MGVGKPRRLFDRRHAGTGPAVGDVFGQRTVKQDRILLNDRDLAAQRMLRTPWRYPDRRSAAVCIPADGTAVNGLKRNGILQRVMSGHLATACGSTYGSIHW